MLTAAPPTGVGVPGAGATGAAARPAWTVTGGASDVELAALAAVVTAVLGQAPTPLPDRVPAPHRVWGGPWVHRWVGRHRYQ